MIVAERCICCGFKNANPVNESWRKPVRAVPACSGFQADRFARLLHLSFLI
ncbi:hypothetical protein B4096_0048 [Heyndrickxia coagulans]|uniref:Uncharacterized protein n=1 Tax=Heyndrickxia coagulans TaxID=1398 RepID=A0A133KC49_HEYCO|nr:hypothetical protein HMPREF3213_03331 [Heyndrickxia coagulans]KYC90384.1 hypothetical protein B4096_0048 [Heyndrickxia coagulans]